MKNNKGPGPKHNLQQEINRTTNCFASKSSDTNKTDAHTQKIKGKCPWTVIPPPWFEMPMKTASHTKEIEEKMSTNSCFHSTNLDAHAHETEGKTPLNGYFASTSSDAQKNDDWNMPDNLVAPQIKKRIVFSFLLFMFLMSCNLIQGSLLWMSVVVKCSRKFQNRIEKHRL